MLSDLFGWHFLFEKTLREIKKGESSLELSPFL